MRNSIKLPREGIVLFESKPETRNLSEIQQIKETP